MARLAGMALLLGLTGLAHAQVLTGEIDGTVKDSSGAVVPNATVIVRNSDQNLVVRTVTSDSQGQFTAPLLSVGGYSLNISSPGFKTSTVANIQVHVGQPSAVQISLDLGTVSEDVTVTADAVTPQLDTAASSTLIDSEQTTQLPLSSRDFLQLLYIQPGISGGIPGPDDRGNITTSGQVNTQTFSVNGNSTASNGYFIDGSDILKRAGQQPVAFPGVDFIQEINLQRSEYGAEFGGAGAAFVSVQTKAGTTNFHGGAFGFFRSQVLNANAYFNNLAGVPRGGVRYADFGGYIGGPVFIPKHTDPKNAKTFFFFGLEYLRSANSVQQTLTNISTPAQRQGIFTTPVCVLYAASGACAANGTTTHITNINPIAQEYLKDIINPLPTPNNPSDPQGLISQQTGFNNESQYIIRIDHQFNSKLSVFFRLLNDPFSLVVPDGFQATSLIPGVATSRMTDGSTDWLGHFTYVLSTNHIFEGGYAYRSNYVTAQPIGSLEAANSPDINVTLPFANVLGQVPHININGSNFAVTGPYNERSPLQQIFVNNTNTLGRHTLQFGTNIEFETGGSTAASANAGLFTFSPGTLVAGETQFDQAFANFLLGNVTTFTQAATNPGGANHTNIYEGYAQDNFKASARLTLTAGIRYSYFSSATEAQLAGNAPLPVQNFDPAAYNPLAAPTIDTKGLICVAGAACSGGKVPNPAYNPTNGIIIGNQNSPFGADVQTTPNKDFGPRLGFTEDVFGNGKLALRGGYGIYYLAVTGNQAKFATMQDAPNVTNVTISNTTFANPSAGVVGTSPSILQALETHDPPSYSQQYSLDVQEQIGSGTVIDVGYYGNHGVHLYNNIDENQAPVGLAARDGVLAVTNGVAASVNAGNTPLLNQIRPYLGYSSITTQESVFSSNYNSLQASLRQRIRGGAIITASYTYAKALTNSRVPQNSANVAAEYGEDPNNRVNVFNSSFAYPLPFFRDQKGIVGHTLGGFEFAGIISFGSGEFLTATTTALDPSGVGLLVGPATGRPDQLSNPNVGAPHSFNEWFNTQAFTPGNLVGGVKQNNFPTGQVTPGNASVSNILGPGYENFDLSAYKNVLIERGINLQLRAEGYNVLNHTNFAGIQTTTSASNYGQVTSTGPNRILQLGAKVTF